MTNRPIFVLFHFKREASVDQYEAHIRRVKEIVPKERLLIRNVKDGWEPVCKFLGKPVPNIPIPVSQRLEKQLNCTF